VIHQPEVLPGDKGKAPRTRPRGLTGVELLTRASGCGW
jgi:hypothetical protein